MGDTITSLTVTHANLYTASIDEEDMISFHEDNDVIAITFNYNYSYKDSGSPRWRSVEPLDKDEITYMKLEFENGETKNIAVPFEDTSPNGAYCINEKSKEYLNGENYITIEWRK